MRALARLSLSAPGRLRTPRALPPGRATLATGLRAHLRYPRRIRARAAIGLAANAIAPRGLGARLVVSADKYSNAILKQVIQVWVNTLPPAIALFLRIDDGPETPVPGNWLNPSGGLPGIYALQDPALPKDGFTHYVTVAVQRVTDGRKSARARYTFTAQLAADPVPQPLWINARLLRQNTTELPDLVEVTWRATTAVTILANLRPRGYSGGAMTPLNVRLGTAGPEEGRLLVEGIGPLLKPLYGYPCDVYLGAIGLAQGQESPALWCARPLSIIAADGEPAKVTQPTTPDTLAGTAVALVLATAAGNAGGNPWQTAILATLAASGPLPANAASIIDQAWAKFWLRIKTRINANMTITLDDFGVFSSTITHPTVKRDVQTSAITTTPGYRQPTYKPALAFKVGTKLGQIFTDAQAKESL